MKNVEIISRLTEYESENELNAEDRALVAKAKATLQNAYAPYSKFLVGAAILLENGIIITGNNQENASYPIGLCAERVAIFAAGANYPGVKIKAIAVSAKSESFNIDKPVPPCGACRQAIAEYEHRYQNPIRIIMSGESGKVMACENIGGLLPFQFNSDDLKNK